jgi:hypothetical protein
MKLKRETRMTISTLAGHGQSGRGIARILAVEVAQAMAHLLVRLNRCAVEAGATTTICLASGRRGADAQAVGDRLRFEVSGAGVRTAEPEGRKILGMLVRRR